LFHAHRRGGVNATAGTIVKFLGETSAAVPIRLPPHTFSLRRTKKGFGGRVEWDKNYGSWAARNIWGEVTSSGAFSAPLFVGEGGSRRGRKKLFRGGGKHKITEGFY